MSLFICRHAAAAPTQTPPTKKKGEGKAKYSRNLICEYEPVCTCVYVGQVGAWGGSSLFGPWRHLMHDAQHDDVRQTCMYVCVWLSSHLQTCIPYLKTYFETCTAPTTQLLLRSTYLQVRVFHWLYLSRSTSRVYLLFFTLLCCTEGFIA